MTTNNWTMKKHTACIQMDVDRKIKVKLDTSGKILYVNNYFTEFTGFSVSEVILKDFERLLDPSMPKLTKDKLKDLSNQYSAFHFIIKGAMKADSCYWGFVRVSKTVDKETGEVKGHLMEIKMLPAGTIPKIEKMFDVLNEIEKNAGLDAALKYFNGYLEERNVGFDEYILSLVEIDHKKANAYFEIDEDQIVKKKKRSWF